MSYAGPDRPWAEWAAWHLREAGHRVEIDVWDWQAGDNFVERMTDAMRRATVVVALFSNHYFDRTRWVREEWTSIVARRERLIPLAIEPLTDVDVPDILSSVIRKDLHGLDEQAAIRALLDSISGPAGPLVKPNFPGMLTGIPAPLAGLSSQRPRLPSGAGLIPRIWNVRERNPHFTGREAQIGIIRDSLLSGRRSVAIHGLGGIGKSQIGIEYAHRFASQYDIIWWIDAEQADQILVRYTELAARLGIAKVDGGTIHNVRTLLEYLRNQDRWLIVLDNADNPQDLEGLTPAGPGHVLITSRNPGWNDRVHSLNLGVFARNDSRAYLVTRIPGIALKQADDLAEDLGDLPLALAQAAGVISSGMTVDRYRLLLSEKTTTLMANGDHHGYPAPLAATVVIATNRLSADRRDAVDLLRLGAFLGPDPIPIAWLESVHEHLTSLVIDPDDFMWPHAAIRALARYGLARVDHETFQIHRLTQAILRDRFNEAETATTEHDVATILMAAAHRDPDSPANWPEWASLASHLTARQYTAAKYGRLRETSLQAAFYLIRSGQLRAASELTTALLQAWRGDLGEDDRDVLTAAQYLGQVTMELGRYDESRKIIEDTLGRRRRILGDDHLETLRSANDLAIVLHYLGKYDEGLRLDEDTFSRRRRILGEDHPETLRSAHNVIGAWSSLERFDEARQASEDAFHRVRRSRGVDHPDTFHFAHSLAVVLHGLGEFEEAQRLDEETFARRRRVLGEDHPETLRSAASCASGLRGVGELDEARRMGEDVLAGRRRVLGEDHPDTVDSALSLAITLREMGELDEARRMGEDVLARRRRVLGEDHPDFFVAAANLGVTLYRLGALAEAREIEEDTLARRRRILGEDHVDTLRSAYYLSRTLSRLRKHPTAVRLLRDTRTRSRRSLKPDHPLTEQITRALADELTAVGKEHEAQKLRSSLKARERKKRRTKK